jgi:hypothetical protein
VGRCDHWIRRQREGTALAEPEPIH